MKQELLALCSWNKSVLNQDQPTISHKYLYWRKGYTGDRKCNKHQCCYLFLFQAEVSIPVTPLPQRFSETTPFFASRQFS